MKAAPTLQSDAFGHTQAELRLVELRHWAATFGRAASAAGDDAGEDDKRESDYERPTYVNPQTGALERM